MKYIIAHDIGTSGNKASLFSTEGELICSQTYSYKTHWFNHSHAEQNPVDWYEAIKVTTSGITNDIDVEDVLAISFSGQMMGCVLVDENGSPLRPGIIWADTRAHIEEDFIRSRINEDEFYGITGHRISSSYSLAKVLWVKNNEEDIYKKTHKMLNPKDYIIYRLTNKFVTDYSDASGTNILDLNKLEWSDEIVKQVNLRLDILPNLVKSTDVVGRLTEQGAYDLGLSTNTVVVAGGGDGAMSAIGARCIHDGDWFATIGNSAWVARTSKKPIIDKARRIFNWAHVVPNMYIPCGTMQAAGASIKWIKEMLLEGIRDETEAYNYMNEIVNKSPIGSNGITYLPYLMGERSPRWNPKARGCFLGMDMSSSKEDLIRSVYEGISLNLEVIRQILDQGDKSSEILVTGGGAKSLAWLQMFADIFNKTIIVPTYVEEATSIGAAVSAGVGIGIYDSFDVVNDFIHVDKRIEPKEENVNLYQPLKEVFELAYESLVPYFNKNGQSQEDGGNNEI